MTRSFRLAAAALILAPLSGACRAITPAPSADAPAPQATVAPPASDTARPGAASAAPGAAARRHTAADVAFMQGMIGHHAQAIVMAALVPERTERTDLRALAGRVIVSQQDEIAQMRAWLERRGEAVPAIDTSVAHVGHGTGGHDAHAGHGAMPGMLTGAELATLASRRGVEFEKLFLDYMIRHHEGALSMVAQLFATPGAAQETETFQFASDVDADQRAEIARMRALRNALR